MIKGNNLLLKPICPECRKPMSSGLCFGIIKFMSRCDGGKGEMMKKYKDLTKSEKEEIAITVCPSCHKASCISADHPCDDFWNAGEWKEALIDIEKLGLEHPDHWQVDIDEYFDEKEKIYDLVKASLEHNGKL